MKLTWNLSYIYYIKKIDFQRNLNIFSPIINMHGSSEVLVYATIEIKLKRILFAVTKYKSWEENSFIYFKQHLSKK